MAADTPAARPVRHRPRTATVFVAAFVAGAAAAVGVNRALDVRLAQAKPQVECEPIFVALRSLPAGTPVTVWDVALRDLPKAMVPATALRVTDSFAGRLLKYPLREGQPLLSAQLVQPQMAAPAGPETPATERAARESLVEEAFVAPVPAAAPAVTEVRAPEIDSPETIVHRAAADEPGPDQATGPETRTVEVAGGEPVASSLEAGEVAEPLAATAAPTEAGETEAPRMAAADAAPVAAPADPTPAEPTPTSAPLIEPAPKARLSPEMFAGPAADGYLLSDHDATLDMPSRPAVDLADLPSVMASDDDDAAGTEDGAGSGVRYLVVPERIARQADTSFTTPPAPEAAAKVKPTDQAGRGAAATARPATAAPHSSVPPATASRAEGGQQGRKPAPRQQQQQQRRATSGTRQQPGLQPAKTGAAAGQAAAAGTPPSGPRAWGGIFPNVAAGLEAMGSWRTGNRGATNDQSERGSTKR